MGGEIFFARGKLLPQSKCVPLQKEPLRHGDGRKTNEFSEYHHITTPSAPFPSISSPGVRAEIPSERNGKSPSPLFDPGMESFLIKIVNFTHLIFRFCGSSSGLYSFIASRPRLACCRFPLGECSFNLLCQSNGKPKAVVPVDGA